MDIPATAAAVLGAAIDEDTLEYLCSVLEEAPTRDDSLETVESFLESAGAEDAGALAAKLFDALEAGGAEAAGAAEADLEETTGRLDKALTMGEADAAAADPKAVKLNFDGSLAGAMTAEGKPVPPAYIYNDAMETQTSAISSKARRKQLQREAREAAVAEERRREEERIAANAALGIGDEFDSDDDDFDTSGGVDVHLESFDLDNKKGVGTLLSNANLTLAAGRRYVQRPLPLLRWRELTISLLPPRPLPGTGSSAATGAGRRRGWRPWLGGSSTASRRA